MELGNRLIITVSQGEEIIVEGQKFIGFTAIVKNLDEVCSAYARIATQHAEARHLVSAWCIPGEDWHHLQDFSDDDEHGLGAELLHLLATCKIYNRALFVARIYDGTHIGPKRIDAFKDAAKSAIVTAPFNREHNLHQFPWPAEDQYSSTSNQGAYTGGIRGGTRSRGFTRRTPPSPQSVG